MSSDIKTIFIIVLLMVGSVWLIQLWRKAPESHKSVKGRLLLYGIIMGLLAILFILKYMGVHVPVVNP